jgi:hypothetical protein
MDPLSLDASKNPIAITRIKWEDAQALPLEMCLSDMVVHGNIVFATAGETIREFFTIGTNQDIPAQVAQRVGRALERQGPLDEIACRRSVTFLYSLKQTETRGLGWLGELHNAEPEVELQEVKAANLQPLTTPQIWQWQRTLLDARGFEDAFTLDDGTWRRIIGFRRIGEVIEHVDYVSGSGFTIRFGDGEFGRTPPDKTVFRVRYRTGPGTRANLPADTVVNLRNPEDKTQDDLASVLDAVTNPLPITSGVDPEDAGVIKQLAPESLRAITFRGRKFCLSPGPLGSPKVSSCCYTGRATRQLNSEPGVSPLSRRLARWMGRTTYGQRSSQFPCSIHWSNSPRSKCFHQP